VRVGLHLTLRVISIFSAKEIDVVEKPKKPSDFMANAAANDVYKIKLDGTDLVRLTNTKDRGEKDVSVSKDGSMVTFMDTVVSEKSDVTEIWVMNSDGKNPRLVYTGGPDRISSVHDPEISPDNTKVIFSKVNLEVPPNFPNDKQANTAHDIYSINIDGTNLIRLTKPGPISIIPDWIGNNIVYLHINEMEKYAGAAIINPHELEQIPIKIKHGLNMPRFIP